MVFSVQKSFWTFHTSLQHSLYSAMLCIVTILWFNTRCPLWRPYHFSWLECLILFFNFWTLFLSTVLGLFFGWCYISLAVTSCTYPYKNLGLGWPPTHPIGTKSQISLFFLRLPPLLYIAIGSFSRCGLTNLQLCLSSNYLIFIFTLYFFYEDTGFL